MNQKKQKPLAKATPHPKSPDSHTPKPQKSKGAAGTKPSGLPPYNPPPKANEWNQGIVLLSQMGELLLNSQSAEDIYKITGQYLFKLFPHSSGGLFIQDELDTDMETKLVWGDHPEQVQAIPKDNCWALRFGKPHMVIDPDAEVLCRHVQEVGIPYVCAPMFIQGKPLGVLQVLLGKEPSAAHDYQWLDTEKHLIRLTAIQVGLALSGIQSKHYLLNSGLRDPQSGLFNRLFMEEIIEKELIRARRKNMNLGLMLLSLDWDAYPPSSIKTFPLELLLRQMGLYLNQRIRSSDIACRYNETEFIIILPEAGVETTLDRAEELVSNVRELHLFLEEEVFPSISLSAGVAIYPRHGNNLEELLQATEAALFLAKKSGKGRVSIANNTL